jgi:hypothetical protein
VLAGKARLTAEAAASAALLQELKQSHAAAAASHTSGLPPIAQLPLRIDEDSSAPLWPPRVRVAWADGPVACAEAFEGFWRCARLTISRGEALWADKKKRPALRLYQEASAALRAQLPTEDCSLWSDMAAAVDAADAHITAEAPAKAAFALKRAIDSFSVNIVAEINALRVKGGLLPLDLDTTSPSMRSPTIGAGGGTARSKAAPVGRKGDGGADGPETSPLTPLVSARSPLGSPASSAVTGIASSGGGDLMASVRIAELEVEVEELKR